MRPQIYLSSGFRSVIIKRHDFFVEQIRARILSQFSNIEEEAEKFAEAEYERIGNLPGGEDFDMSQAAEAATANGQEFYSLLSDLRKQTTLSAVAGMYHQWDKELRDFLELELRHYYKSDDVRKLTWLANVDDVFDILKQFGWDCTQLPFFNKIDACRLVVNVYKHGKGTSLESLNKKYPQYLDNPMREFKFMEGHLDYEWLAVTDAQITEFATAFREFWSTFPQRLFLEGPTE